MRKILAIIIVCSLIAGSGWGIGSWTWPGQKPAFDQKPLIQIALLLDTSDNMSSLIEQTQSQLWQIVNELASYRQYGQTPQLQVALFEFGKSRIPASQGHLQMTLPFTGDLDAVSEQLFNLTAQGGPKYCGKAIQTAVDSLFWSGAQDDIKVIFIIGCEPFNQGPVEYRRACEAAVAQGIVVNTIYCGDHQVGIANEWQDAADLTGGMYLSIDQDQTEVYIEAPQDKRIAELAFNLNDTYIPFGPQGSVGLDNQNAQDQNALDAGEAVILRRALLKSSLLYLNPDWDLVDAVKEKIIRLENIEKADLPPKLQKMTLQQQQAYVEALSRQRSAIRRQIQQLSLQRIKYVDPQGQNPDPAPKNSLAEALIEMTRNLALKKSFILEQTPQAPGS